MSYMNMSSGKVIAQADGDTKQLFIRKTYLHLIAAIILFAILESIFISLGFGNVAMKLLNSIGSFGWLGVLFLYGFASHFMHKYALKSITLEQQYMAWVGGIILEAFIFLPLIAIAMSIAPNGGILHQAVIITIALVIALTAVVLTTGKDFSFLRPALTIGFFVAIAIIVLATIFGFGLGVYFSGAMIIFASAAILYETSQIQHHYSENQYVGASLSLFASVGLLFWYVLQFLLSFTGGD